MQQRTGVVEKLKFLKSSRFYFIYDSHTERERQAEGEAGSMHQEPNMGFDLGSPGSRLGPKAGTKPLRHPGIPEKLQILNLKGGCIHFSSKLDDIC